jgi:hypothetical protein
MKLMKPKQRLDKNMDDLFKITQSLRNVALLVWASFIAYVVYVEFVRDIVTIL